MNENFYGVLETRNIDRVQVGDLEYQTWYGNSLYFGNDCKTLGYKYSHLDSRLKKVVKKQPSDIWLDKLYVCGHCFKYTDESESMEEHRQCCKYATKQPGRVKYKDSQYTIRKVKGSRHELFTQCLCLFAKLFLDSKSIFFSVENFDFYVVYGEVDGRPTPMGYFSKEILQCFDENNLGCICVFPPYQNRKLGTLLISFSYELSRYQGIISGPEHPLSTFGKVSYINFWSKYLAHEFLYGRFRYIENITIDEIARYTGFRQEDVVTALESMHALRKVPLQDSPGDSNKFSLLVSKTAMEQWVTGKNVNLESLRIFDDHAVIFE
ncbi:histone acetyltransferase [Saccharomycopsis crataegensis]|uniref:histone acetyltransferase n=1 Tax=Saccharomycopsis crataegensis TaxID=43959 RepID=A0AAV5QPS0_9ASCO|nr:histone acetyltransferase [Saccharomycopsis crataegensis]